MMKTINRATISESDECRGTILVTDDEPGMRSALREVLARAGWRTILADRGEQALEVLDAGEDVDLLMTDNRMDGMTGMELLHAVRALRPDLRSVMMTAFGTIEDAVSAMKEGADDYLLKPFTSETILEVVERLTKQVNQSGSTGTPPPARAAAAPTGAPIIAHSPRLQTVLKLARDVAEAKSTVLLRGESGTGKEVVARYLHQSSGRRGGLVAVNCAALPEGLLESELFGHEKGAFTGAILSRKGCFEQAQGGTLLLDEISEMPPALQAKLLRVLQEREITPVGGSGTVRLDVRVIATTNRDLDKAVAEGDFRQDLFYRLNVITLNLPPLRERPEDILPLAEHFLTKYRPPGRAAQRLGDDVRLYLAQYDWPGNVRELENVIERACLLARGECITLDHLQVDLSQVRLQHDGQRLKISMDEPLTLEEMERLLILQTLDFTGGNRTRAADLLGVSVRTIRNKLHQYGLSEAV